MSLLPKILVKRFAGTEKEKPAFRVYKDGTSAFSEEIEGRQDVQPAFLRVQNKVKTQYGVEQLFPAGRDAQKHLQWMSVNPNQQKEPPAASTKQ